MRRVNKYTTTLHALNSAIVKLSKLTKASTVYRGVHDMVLPDQFWTPNKYGVRGGIDSAFMSTTLKREEAVKYATSGKAAPLIFEIQQGMIDRGVKARKKLPDSLLRIAAPESAEEEPESTPEMAPDAED